ncbi:protein VASCULATURE COMPLEXITY AND CONNECTIVITY [Euphorbia lathyris]|uniref:protein VASCULATURE COMPLEXITY AND CONNECTIVITY n=1 Tax=Euphorbia lathyris TaxID=212925 RepID=UPI0033136D3A
MERKGLFICCAVGLLGLLSAATGFSAEATRIKGSEVEFTSATQCTYPRSPAMALGLTSALALMIAQVIINVATGCICCKTSGSPSNSNWTIALVCFVVSWFTFVIAFLLLLTGAALNDQHGEESMYFGNYYCYVVKPGVFGGGAVLALASVTLGILYYLTLNSSKSVNNTTTSSGIAMGHPQVTSQDPVFVHQDTYIRRQFT